MVKNYNDENKKSKQKFNGQKTLLESLKTFNIFVMVAITSTCKTASVLGSALRVMSKPYRLDYGLILKAKFFWDKCK